MDPLSPAAVRASFVNCTKGEAKRLALPRDLAERPWEDLDFLGWRDPSTTDRGYLVADTGAGTVGVALRVAPSGGQLRRSMCSLCLTTHTADGVALMTARKAGPSGRQGNSVGVYICSDLACSLHLRGRKDSGLALDETLSLGEKVARTRANLVGFLGRVTG